MMKWIMMMKLRKKWVARWRIKLVKKTLSLAKQLKLLVRHQMQQQPRPLTHGSAGVMLFICE